MLEGILKAFSPAPPLSPPPWDAWIPLTVFLARGHPGSPVINSLSGISLSAPLPTPIAIRSLTVTKRHGQQKLCPLWTVTLASRFFSSLVSFGERVPTWFQYLFFFFPPSESLFQSTGENEAPWRGPGLGGQSLWHPWCSTSCLSQRPSPIPIFIWCLSKYLKAALTAPKGLVSHPD